MVRGPRRAYEVSKPLKPAFVAVFGLELLGGSHWKV